MHYILRHAPSHWVVGACIPWTSRADVYLNHIMVQYGAAYQTHCHKCPSVFGAGFEPCFRYRAFDPQTTKLT